MAKIVCCLFYLLLYFRGQSQIQIEFIPQFEHIGDTVSNYDGTKHWVLNEITPEIQYFISEWSGHYNYIWVNYYVLSDSLSRILSINIKSRHQSVDGGNCKNCLYEYQYDSYDNVIQSSYYKKKLFGYKLIYKKKYNPVTNKVDIIRE